jgi:serine/threonine-protein kinase
MSQHGDGTFSSSSFEQDASHLELPAGTQVGEYQILETIGRGGFGTVFKAVHPLIDKVVAIKVLHPAYSSQPQMVSRFSAEARAVNRIQHRNIIDIFGFGKLEAERGQLHYYVMEHLQGQSLEDFLVRQGRLPVDVALGILWPIARALHAAHQNGVAHRDLKADNIFLAEDRERFIEPKLLDFGIAKLLHDENAPGHRTRDGMPIGTPGYMSPEQCLGQAVDHRTDVYAFGVLAYRMLTGTLPFRDDSYMKVMFAHINSPPRPPRQYVPALPESIEQAILCMLAKNPADRPQTMLAAQQSLEGAATAAGLALMPESSRLTLSLLHQAKPVRGSTDTMLDAPTLDADSAEGMAALAPRSAPAGSKLDSTGPTVMPTADGAGGAQASARAASAQATVHGSGRASRQASSQDSGQAAVQGIGRDGVPDPASGPIPPTRRTVLGSAPRWRGLALGAAALAGIAIAGAALWPRADGTAAPATGAHGPGANADTMPAAAIDPPAPAPPPAPPGATVTPGAPATGATSPAAPELVTVTVSGPPAGTEVYGPSGLLGVVPGAIQLPRGDTEVLLTFRAEGYRTVTQPVTPSAATTLTIELERKAGPRQRPRRDRDGNVLDELESPF